jgi:cytolysin (calcineurin-like family phosphatase)
MPIKQFFSKEGGNKIQSTDDGSFIDLECGDIVKDSIDWDDAGLYVNSFKQFAADHDMGDSLSFLLSQESINKLFTQNGTNGIRIYLAYCNTDKTIRAFAVAATYDPSSKQYDDFGIPEVSLFDTAKNSMPLLENTRPCPTQCGKRNVLNRRLP